VLGQSDLLELGNRADIDEQIPKSRRLQRSYNKPGFRLSFPTAIVVHSLEGREPSRLVGGRNGAAYCAANQHCLIGSNSTFHGLTRCTDGLNGVGWSIAAQVQSGQALSWAPLY
jgi:hypothetical protein